MTRPWLLAVLPIVALTLATSPARGLRRSAAAQAQYMRVFPCPSTGRPTGPCPGYTLDHITPLKRGGADAWWTLRWLGTIEAKAKDRWE